MSKEDYWNLTSRILRVGLVFLFAGLVLLLSMAAVHDWTSPVIGTGTIVQFVFGVFLIGSGIALVGVVKIANPVSKTDPSKTSGSNDCNALQNLMPKQWQNKEDNDNDHIKLDRKHYLAFIRLILKFGYGAWILGLVTLMAIVGQWFAIEESFDPGSWSVALTLGFLFFATWGVTTKPTWLTLKVKNTYAIYENPCTIVHFQIFSWSLLGIFTVGKVPRFRTATEIQSKASSMSCMLKIFLAISFLLGWTVLLLAELWILDKIGYRAGSEFYLVTNPSIIGIQTFMSLSFLISGFVWLLTICVKPGRVLAVICLFSSVASLNASCYVSFGGGYRVSKPEVTMSIQSNNNVCDCRLLAPCQ